ncbi:MAG: O-antigen/teichoic acid export membrane protein, partial [Woeseiaceae bacterium]
MKKIKKLVYLGGMYSIGNLMEKGIAFFFIPIYTSYLDTSDYGIIGVMMI